MPVDRQPETRDTVRPQGEDTRVALLVPDAPGCCPPLKGRGGVGGEQGLGKVASQLSAAAEGPL